MPRYWFLNISLYSKEPKILEQMADTRAGAEKVKADPEHLVMQKKQGSAQIMMGLCMK